MGMPASHVIYSKSGLEADIDSSNWLLYSCPQHVQVSLQAVIHDELASFKLDSKVAHLKDSGLIYLGSITEGFLSKLAGSHADGSKSNTILSRMGCKLR